MQGAEKNREDGRKGMECGREEMERLKKEQGMYTVTRLEYIQLKLRRGDKKKIAEKLNVHPEWVSQVIRGKGVSEPVLLEAERLIAERFGREKARGVNLRRE